MQKNALFRFHGILKEDLFPNIRLDSLIWILNNKAQYYHIKYIHRQAEIDNMGMSAARKRYQDFHHDDPMDDEKMEDYEISRITDVLFAVRNKKTERTYKIWLLPDEHMPCRSGEHPLVTLKKYEQFL